MALPWPSHAHSWNRESNSATVEKDSGKECMHRLRVHSCDDSARPYPRYACVPLSHSPSLTPVHDDHNNKSSATNRQLRPDTTVRATDQPPQGDVTKAWLQAQAHATPDLPPAQRGMSPESGCQSKRMCPQAGCQPKGLSPQTSCEPKGLSPQTSCQPNGV